ncbi:MAG: hypothetical protein ACRDNS_32640 [Trebonia sp.]
MSVDIRINITFPPPNTLSATWTTGSVDQAADQGVIPADAASPSPDLRVMPIGTSLLAPGLVTQFAA